MHKLFPFKDFMYLLQLTDYDRRMYLRKLPKFFLRRTFERRGKLDYTRRVKTMLLLCLIIFLLPILAAVRVWPESFAAVIAVAVASAILIPLWIVLADILLAPLYLWAKKRLRARAAARFRALSPRPKVIGIAGSYGKTTTKHFICQLVDSSYRTEMTPGNVNTAEGIAAWILSPKLSGAAGVPQALIIEMDTYKKGELSDICAITPPDIAIITNIGDQHLERFGSRRRLAEALLEIFEHLAPGAARIMTEEGMDMLVKLGAPPPGAPPILVETSADSSAAMRNLPLAVEAARLLGVPDRYIADTVPKLVLPDRRKNMIVTHGYSVIDDSYNISQETALASLGELTAVKGLKKGVVVTAGIPELGPENRDANTVYGKALAKAADFTIVLASDMGPQIERELPEGTFAEAGNVPHAWELIQARFAPDEAVILMQSELTDLYY